MRHCGDNDTILQSFAIAGGNNLYLEILEFYSRRALAAVKLRERHPLPIITFISHAINLVSKAWKELQIRWVSLP